jgi:histidinol-phosphate aminotransferase
MSAPRPRSTLAGVRVYERSLPAPIDLSDNTNRWGSAPCAMADARSGSADLSRYPEAYCASLKQAIATYVGVTSEQVTTGCGSDGVLDAAIRAFGEPGDMLAVLEPTFPMPVAFAHTNALTPVRIPLSPSYGIDAAIIAAFSARIVYLCTPNNPLGASLDPLDIVATAQAIPQALVIVDEAYAEFAGRTFIPHLTTCSNVLVVRTFSKAFGLAGARVGYGIGSPDVIREVERARGPYQVNATGARAALIALRQDLEWVRDRVAIARSERERLRNELRALGLDPLPSSANFVFVPTPDAVVLGRFLAGRGIGVRVFENLAPVSAALARSGGTGLRITVGPPHEMNALRTALTAAMREVTCA